MGEGIGQAKPARIMVMGVGGGGGQAVEHMIAHGVQVPEFICADTEAQALQRCSARSLVQLGRQGLGACNRPEMGRAAADEAVERIRQAIAGAHLLFITAGMGGGTGTGAAPVIARVARELGIPTVGVVTKPFPFEGRRRGQQAEDGVSELEVLVDSLIVVEGGQLVEMLGDDATQERAFACANDMLKHAVGGISDIINMPALALVDLEDVATVMREPGKGAMGTAVAGGPDRATQAAEAAMTCPLLRGIDLSGARSVLVLITASKATFQLAEARHVMKTVQRQVADDADVVCGTAFDETLADKLRVTVVATGLNRPKKTPGLPPWAGGIDGPGPRTGRIKPPSQNQLAHAAVPQPSLAHSDGGLNTPSVWRGAGGRAAGKVDAPAGTGMDEIEIPAFLRKQAEISPSAAPPVRPQAAKAREQVHLGVTAPQRCRPGANFNAVLAVYIESARGSAVEQLGRLGGPRSESLMGLAPQRQSGWEVGAPVTVSLVASSAQVTPAEQHFEWNGRLNLTPFVVSVDPKAGTGRGAVVDLCFSVALAGVPIAFIPLPVQLASDVSDTPVQMPVGVPVPGLAFASYSSKDAETVGHCLSALSRWSPDFRCIQDCLDLRPDESFKTDIRRLIEKSDRFILFWSRSASASPWVRWEYDTARITKGLDAVVPMPLEDPSIAPPPSEFADRHMRDRFMMARYALERISQIAAGPGTQG